MKRGSAILDFLCERHVGLRKICLCLAGIGVAAFMGLLAPDAKHWVGSGWTWTQEIGSVPLYLLALVFGPALVEPSIARIWNKITPVRDRTTHIECEIIYLWAVFVGTTLGIVFLTPHPATTALLYSAVLVVLMSPLCGILWWTIASVRPIDRERSRIEGELDADVIEKDPILTNLGAYALALIANWAVTLLLLAFALMFVSPSYGPHEGLNISTEFAFALWPCILVGAILSPMTVAISRGLLPGIVSVGWHYFLGHIGILAAVLSLMSVVFGPSDVFPYDTRSYVTAAAIIVAGYACGGWVLSRIYRKADFRPLEFA